MCIIGKEEEEEPKLRSKYLLKSKNQVISLSENMATIYSPIRTDSLVNYNSLVLKINAVMATQ